MEPETSINGREGHIDKFSSNYNYLVSLVPLVLLSIKYTFAVLKKNKNTNITLTTVQLAEIYIKKEYNPHTNTIMQAYLKT